MSLYFITGTSGSGKSAVCQELRSRGYEALDTDEDALSKWQHNTEGHIHPKSSVKQKDRTESFLKNHSWNIPVEEVESIANRAKDSNIFICGVADNLKGLLYLFKSVFALSIDEDTLRHRLKTRLNNDWGKQPHELKSTLEQHKIIENHYEKAGFTVIDATQPVKTVVDKIIALI